MYAYTRHGRGVMRKLQKNQFGEGERLAGGEGRIVSSPISEQLFKFLMTHWIRKGKQPAAKYTRANGCPIWCSAGITQPRRSTSQSQRKAEHQDSHYEFSSKSNLEFSVVVRFGFLHSLLIQTPIQLLVVVHLLACLATANSQHIKGVEWEEASCWGKGWHET